MIKIVEYSREEGRIMAAANKTDCISINDATKEARVSRATLYTYMNVLGVQRIKFPFDRKSYILKSDLDRVKTFIEQSRG
jgi:hypothetical protein